MNAPIGAGIILPKHLLTGSNQQYLIKFNDNNDNNDKNENLCFWRCLAFCFAVIENPKKDSRRVEKMLKNDLMNIMKVKKILNNIVE